ncbi:MAG: hypothetical protein LBI69_00130 [Puniceicoccales bacterium]|jgi:hypothetical protein|nr:hypothetical protein [Puniceicoccales bacterium]
MTISKFSNYNSFPEEMPKVHIERTKEERELAKIKLAYLVCEYEEFEDELVQMYWDRVDATERQGLSIDVVAIEKDIGREMEKIGPDILQAREERMQKIRDPKTRATTPKLRQFEWELAASLDQTDASKARADAMEAQVAEQRRKLEEMKNSEKKTEQDSPSQICLLV